MLKNHRLVNLNDVVVLITKDFFIKCRSCIVIPGGTPTNNKPDGFKVIATGHGFSDIKPFPPNLKR